MRENNLKFSVCFLEESGFSRFSYRGLLVTPMGDTRAQFHHGGFYCLRERGDMGACFSEWVSEALKLKVA